MSAAATKLRRALVTGGATGIGRAMALALAREGYEVWVCGRRAEPLAALARHQPAIRVLACDVTDHVQRERMVRELSQSGPELDPLINNAGVQYPSPIGPSIDVALVEQEIAVNLTAPILLTAALTPLLERGLRPLVVNVSSGLALAPKASAPVYCATKAALSHFSLALGFQYEARRIQVMDVIAPLVDTEMTRGRGRRKISPEQFAREVVRALSRRPSRLHVGRARLLALLVRVWPRFGQRLLRAG